MQLRFFFDLTCAHAYIVLPRLLDLAERARCLLVLAPIVQPAELNATNTPVCHTCLSMRTDKTLRPQLTQDLKTLAAYHGVPLNHCLFTEQNAVWATTWLYRYADDMRIEAARALMHALFVDGLDISCKSEAQSILAKAGLPVTDADVGGDEAGALADTARQAAEDLGRQAQVLGLPAYVLSVPHAAPTLFMGGDRLPLVARCLGRRDGAVVRSRFRKHAEPAKLIFYYDFASPYAYVAATQVEAMVARQGAQLIWQPVSLLRLLAARGLSEPGWALAPKKRLAYSVRDMGDWADFYHVPWRWPKDGPADSMQALLLAMSLRVDQRAALSLALFRAQWQQGRNLADVTVLLDVARQIGLAKRSTQRLLEADAQQKARQHLNEATDEALRRGLIGTPGFRVGKHAFFGQDRLPVVEQALADCTSGV